MKNDAICSMDDVFNHAEEEDDFGVNVFDNALLEFFELNQLEEEKRRKEETNNCCPAAATTTPRSSLTSGSTRRSLHIDRSRSPQKKKRSKSALAAKRCRSPHPRGRSQKEEEETTVGKQKDDDEMETFGWEQLRIGHAAATAAAAAVSDDIDKLSRRLEGREKSKTSLDKATAIHKSSDSVVELPRSQTLLEKRADSHARKSSSGSAPLTPKTPRGSRKLGLSLVVTPEGTTKSVVRSSPTTAAAAPLTPKTPRSYRGLAGSRVVSPEGVTKSAIQKNKNSDSGDSANLETTHARKVSLGGSAPMTPRTPRSIRKLGVGSSTPIVSPVVTTGNNSTIRTGGSLPLTPKIPMTPKTPRRSCSTPEEVTKSVRSSRRQRTSLGQEILARHFSSVREL